MIRRRVNTREGGLRNGESRERPKSTRMLRCASPAVRYPASAREDWQQKFHQLSLSWQKEEEQGTVNVL